MVWLVDVARSDDGVRNAEKKGGAAELQEPIDCMDPDKLHPRMKHFITFTPNAYYRDLNDDKCFNYGLIFLTYLYIVSSMYIHMPQAYFKLSYIGKHKEAYTVCQLRGFTMTSDPGTEINKHEPAQPELP